MIKLVPVTVAAIILSIGFNQAANAQETQQNGLSSVESSSVEKSSVESAGGVPIGTTWTEFRFGTTGSFASGCSEGGCAPSSSGNSVFGDDPPWTFSVPPGKIGKITVTDAFINGDRFEVYNKGVSIGSTSKVATGGSCGDDPETCLTDPLSSHGVFPSLKEGSHEITIKAIDSPFSGGAAYFRVELEDAPILPDHLLCYKVKGKRFKKKEVLVSNQFGKKFFIVIEPDTLCVPSTMEELK